MFVDGVEVTVTPWNQPAVACQYGAVADGFSIGRAYNSEPYLWNGSEWAISIYTNILDQATISNELYRMDPR
jgi:hypothetical protein